MDDLTFTEVELSRIEQIYLGSKDRGVREDVIKLCSKIRSLWEELNDEVAAAREADSAHQEGFDEGREEGEQEGRVRGWQEAMACLKEGMDEVKTDDA